MGRFESCAITPVLSFAATRLAADPSTWFPVVCLVFCASNIVSVAKRVASNAGAAIVPACLSNLRADGVVLRCIAPDDVRIDLVIWPKGEISVVLRTFLDLLKHEATTIRAKVTGHLPK